MTVANKECRPQTYDDVSATTNMEGVSTREIGIEVKGNAVEINWQRDYL